MVLKNKNSIIGILLVVFLWGCSTQKDTFFNRNFHVLNTKYNVMYNGTLAFEKGVKTLNENYEDNFYNQIPIEAFEYDPLTRYDIVQGESSEDFARSEEKAVKAIQKHSMLIDGTERNRYIDEAYLLLGKSRYYSQRFVPALEALNYAILNYPNASLYNETRIWQAKTLIRLENSRQAIENLFYLLRDPLLSKKDREEAHTVMAIAYVDTDTIPKAIYHLKQTELIRHNKPQVARNLFVLGQIYRQQKEIDSSNLYFTKLIKHKRFPYKYRINAKIEKIKNNAENNEKETIESLNELAEDDDNKPYLGKIYYQIGMVELKRDSTTNAVNAFKKSIEYNKKSNFQKELSFQAIGDNYFEKAQFLQAGSYYDSVLKIAENRPTKRILNLKRRRKSLNGIIVYEETVKVTDSIIKIAEMDSKQQRKYFENYVQKLKNKDEAKRIAATNFINKMKKQVSGKWYFYSEKVKQYGEQEFKKNWGNRPLEDNWRLSDRIVQKSEITESKTSSVIARYDVDSYLKKIPKKEEINFIKERRNEAYLKSGLIYKEQFGEIEKAKNRLEKLLTFNPSEATSLSAKYHLYKIYENKDDEKAMAFKEAILKENPESKYAKIIQNPELAKELVDKSTPEKEYENYYLNYVEGNYIKVIENINKILPKYEGHPLLPKYEMLKAYALAKQNGREDFEKALTHILTNYPDTEEAKKAFEILETLNTNQNK